MSSSSTKPTRPQYEIKVAKTRDEVEACFDIRVEVFHVEQGFSMDEEIDEYDKEAVHILLSTPESTPPSASTTSLTPWLQNLTEAAINLLPDALNPSGTSTETGTEKKPETQVPIGTIRYVPKTNKLSRLAIMPDYRKYGFGRVLVDKLEEAAVEAARQGKAEVKDGKVLIKCHSQIYVIPFYEKLGYVQQGERFDEDGAPHQKMIKEITV